MSTENRTKRSMNIKKNRAKRKNANFKIKTTFWCMFYGSLIETVCRARPKATPECNVKLSVFKRENVAIWKESLVFYQKSLSFLSVTH